RHRHQPQQDDSGQLRKFTTPQLLTNCHTPTPKTSKRRSERMNSRQTQPTSPSYLESLGVPELGRYLAVAELSSCGVDTPTRTTVAGRNVPLAMLHGNSARS